MVYYVKGISYLWGAMEKKLLDLAADYLALRDQVETYPGYVTVGAQEKLESIAAEFGVTLRAFLAT
ncbi:hypothetical protein ABIB51_001630 [Arthrobacter sp. UYCu712]